MDLAIISDIHGNATALEAVLTEIERESIDAIVCLGDVAGTGPKPVETLERLQEMACPVVMGNVDGTLLDPQSDTTLNDDTGTDNIFADIDAWCARQLSDDHKDFIRTFDSTLSIDLPDNRSLFCYHGSPRSYSDEIHATTTEDRLDELFEDVNTDVVAGGHTHFPFSRRYRGRTIVNPGSVGLPYTWNREAEEYGNPPWAEYAVMSGETEALRIELRRCAIDVESILQAIHDSAMPHAEQLARGWHVGH